MWETQQGPCWVGSLAPMRADLVTLYSVNRHHDQHMWHVWVMRRDRRLLFMLLPRSPERWRSLAADGQLSGMISLRRRSYPLRRCGHGAYWDHRQRPEIQRARHRRHFTPLILRSPMSLTHTHTRWWETCQTADVVVKLNGWFGVVTALEQP